MEENPTLPPIRGRDADLALIGQRIDDLRAGTGGVVLIEGAPGVGKTRILLETFSRSTRMGSAAARGWPILSAKWST
jgi:predicted ATPase